VQKDSCNNICHERPNAPQQKSPLFDHRVGTGEQLPKRMLSEFAVVP